MTMIMKLVIVIAIVLRNSNNNSNNHNNSRLAGAPQVLPGRAFYGQFRAVFLLQIPEVSIESLDKS